MPRNNYSPEHLRYLQQRRLQALCVRGAQFLLLIGFFLLWETAASRAGLTPLSFHSHRGLGRHSASGQRRSTLETPWLDGVGDGAGLLWAQLPVS